MAVYFSTKRIILNPSRLGKSAILSQFVLICYVLVNKNFGILDGMFKPFIWLTTLLVIASGLHYVYRELKIAGGK